MSNAFIKAKLQELRTLNLKIIKTTSRMDYLFELISSRGIQARRLGSLPRPTGPPKSVIEIQAIDKITAKKEIEDLEDRFRLLTLEMDSILKDIQYLVRSSELVLLQDVYYNQCSPEKLQRNHGRNWGSKLNKIFKQYGVINSE